MRNKRVVIAGGGTGGHIYPGLALADSLKKTHPDIEVHFVGAQGGLEESIVPKHGYPLHLLRVERLHKSVNILRRIKALFLLPFSFVHSMALYVRLRPQWVLGVGGFASGPFVFMASILGGRTAILEPNAYPGLANRWLSKVVRYCFVVFKETAHYFPVTKVRTVGLPVRVLKKQPGQAYSNAEPLKILVFGGSQGSRAINNVVGAWVEQLREGSSHYKIYHQVGARDFAIWQERYAQKYSPFLTYTDYINDMPNKLDWADLVICRAGIGSVIEIAMSCKSAIFIPLPTAADNHQVKNAEALVKENAAILIEEKDLDTNKLNQVIEELRNHPQRINDMAQRLKNFDHSSAQKEILKVLMVDRH